MLFPNRSAISTIGRMQDAAGSVPKFVIIPRIAHEGQQAVRRHVLDMAKSDTAESATVFLDSDRDNRLSRGFPAPRTLFWPADIGFVHLNLAVKVVSAGTDHRPSQLMQPSPGRPVTAETEGALKAQGADAILLAGDKRVKNCRGA